MASIQTDDLIKLNAKEQKKEIIIFTIIIVLENFKTSIRTNFPQAYRFIFRGSQQTLQEKIRFQLNKSEKVLIKIMEQKS